MHYLARGHETFNLQGKLDVPTDTQNFVLCPESELRIFLPIPFSRDDGDSSIPSHLAEVTLLEEHRAHAEIFGAPLLPGVAYTLPWGLLPRHLLLDRMHRKISMHKFENTPLCVYFTLHPHAFLR